MKIIQITLACLVSIVFAGSVFGQQNINESRYVKFADDENIFQTKDNQIEVRDMVLCNIWENESSKPVHIGVNELNNVNKFGIKSHSGQYANQRSCYVIMNNSNYIDTFKKVLHKMQAEYVMYHEEYMSVDEFYQIIQNK